MALEWPGRNRTEFFEGACKHVLAPLASNFAALAGDNVLEVVPALALRFVACLRFRAEWNSRFLTGLIVVLLRLIQPR